MEKEKVDRILPGTCLFSVPLVHHTSEQESFFPEKKHKKFFLLYYNTFTE